MQCRLRLLHHFIDHLPVGGSGRFRHNKNRTFRFAIFAKLIDTNGLAIAVAGPRRKKLIFLLRKAPNNLVRRKRGGSRRLWLGTEPPHVMLFRWRGCKRALRILGVNPPSAQRWHENGKNEECDNP